MEKKEGFWEGDVCRSVVWGVALIEVFRPRELGTSFVVEVLMDLQIGIDGGGS